jgi:hypothetical protein
MIIDHENKRVKFRQSWTSNFGMCPNRARLSALHGDAIRQESDAAFAGTAAHAGIEAFLNGEIAVTDMVDYARHTAYTTAVDGVTAKDGTVHSIQYKSFSDADEMIFHAGNCTQGWINDLLPWMETNDFMEGEAEKHFEFDHLEYRGWTIAHSGTVDWCPTNGNALVDWKTSGRSYRQADKQKWAQQPSAYALAAMNGAFDREYDLPLDFHYGVMVRYKTRQEGEVTTVQRNERHIDWYMQQVKMAMDMFIDIGLDKPWPMIFDGNFLCSKKWCEAYDLCRGATITKEDDLFGYDPK